MRSTTKQNIEGHIWNIYKDMSKYMNKKENFERTKQVVWLSTEKSGVLEWSGHFLNRSSNG